MEHGRRAENSNGYRVQTRALISNRRAPSRKP